MKASTDVKKSHSLFFDIIITLLVFGLIGTGLYYILKPEKTETVQLEYKIVFNSIKKSVASNFSSNEILLSEEGEEMGTIISAMNDRMSFQTLDRTSVNGGYITNYSNEYNTITATVSAKATLKDGTYYVGGQPLRVGEELTLRLIDFYGFATIVSVDTDIEG